MKILENLAFASRRDALTGLLPAALASAAMAPTGSAAADTTATPVMQLFREWLSFHRWIEDDVCLGETDDNELTRRVQEMYRIEDRMFSVPSVGPLDALAKLVAFSSYGDSFTGGGDWEKHLLEEAVSIVEAAA